MNQSEAILLSKKPLGEADLLITLFTKDYGKVKGVAKSAKKSRKRFGGVLETGYIIDAQYKPSNSSDLVRINDASLVMPKVYTNLSLASTYTLWLALELANRFLLDAETNVEKYTLLRRFIDSIYEERVNNSIVVFFLMKWIELVGYKPEFDHCVKCGVACSNCSNFSPELGGFVCRNCDNINIEKYSFHPKSIESIKVILEGNVSQKLETPLYEDLLRFIFYYCKYIIGRPLALEKYLPLFLDI